MEESGKLALNFFYVFDNGGIRGLGYQLSALGKICFTDEAMVPGWIRNHGTLFFAYLACSRKVKR